MTISTNGEGVAVCRCGAELHVVCSAGCPDPVVVFKSELAAMKKPTGNPGTPRRKQIPTPILRPGICAWPHGCEDLVAPRTGKGRKPIFCLAHKGKNPNVHRARAGVAAA